VDLKAPILRVKASLFTYATKLRVRTADVVKMPALSGIGFQADTGMKGVVKSLEGGSRWREGAVGGREPLEGGSRREVETLDGKTQ